MGLRRVYWRTCDGCGIVNNLYDAGTDTPRQALAAAKRNGWQRRQVQVDTELREVTRWDERNLRVVHTGISKPFPVYATHDLCPTCAAKLDKETT